MSPNPKPQVRHGESPAALPSLTGILVLDKPAGITSMDAVAMVRRGAGGARTGHAGTLDPLATGVLVIAIGKATKLIDQLMATDKRYLTTIDLTAFTTTDDREGARSEVAINHVPSESTVHKAVRQFVGEIMQKPPAFSAVKIDGRRAYKLARQGENVEIKPRSVRVHSIELLKYDWPLIELEVHCDKGFYVRSLARDLGIELGTGGHCASIRRTAVGPFTLEISKTPAQMPAEISQEHLISGEAALRMVNDQAC